METTTFEWKAALKEMWASTRQGEFNVRVQCTDAIDCIMGIVELLDPY